MSVKDDWENGEQFQASDANAVAEAVNAAYVKPGTGIPSSDLASAVQTSLGKADSAVQSVASTNITDATTTGKAVLTATDAAAARTTLGVAYGTTGGTVCEGNDSRLSPSSTSITDSTATGRALITAVDAAAARTTLGVPATSHSHAVSDINASTSLALGVGSIELGHASDTTLSRSAAGVLAVEGVDQVNLSASQTLTNKTLTNPTINNYVEGVVAIGTVTSSSTLSLTNGTVQTATLTASTACTFTMPTATAGKSFILLLKQAASTGNGTATFTGVKWGTAGAPTITATAGKMDIVSFFSDGTNWYGSIAQGYTP